LSNMWPVWKHYYSRYFSVSGFLRLI